MSEMMKALLIGRLIRNLRNLKQETMTEFAGSINISQSALSKIENGTQEASITTIESVCDVCGISMYDFFKMLDEKIEVNIDTYIKDPALEQHKIKQELHALIDTMTDEQQKALYVFLLPYQK